MATRAKRSAWSASDALVVVDGAPEAIYACDRKGRVLAANAAFANLLALPETLIGGQDCFAYIHPDFREGVRRAIEDQAAEGVRSAFAEFPFVSASGQIRWVAQHTQLVSRRGVFDGWHALARDVTSARLAASERERVEAHAQHVRHLEALGQLAGGVAHNFNNLLTAVVGFAEDLLAEPGRTESDRRALSQIQRAGRRAASLSRQLLAFSRGREPQSRSSNVIDVLATLQRRLIGLLREDITVSVEVPTAALRARADPSLLEHVLVILMLNAQDALPNGGAIRLEADRLVTAIDRPEVRHGVNSDCAVRIRVSDNGVGMDDAAVRHVFEPFFTTKHAGVGTGLGLAAAYGLVRSVGGTMTVESQPGRGTSFTLCVPEASGDDGPIEAQPAPTVLVVDGDFAVVSLAARVLRHAGFHVRTALNADEARAILDADDVAVVLADLETTGQTGQSFVAEALSAHAGLKGVSMSVYGSLAPLRVPGVPVIGKPFDPSELTATIARVLGRDRDRTSE